MLPNFITLEAGAQQLSLHQPDLQTICFLSQVYHNYHAVIKFCVWRGFETTLYILQAISNTALCLDQCECIANRFELRLFALIQHI